MNRKETMQLMVILEMAYPQFYAKKTPDEKLEAAADALVHCGILADDNCKIVAAMVEELKARDE